MDNQLGAVSNIEAVTFKIYKNKKFQLESNNPYNIKSKLNFDFLKKVIKLDDKPEDLTII